MALPKGNACSEKGIGDAMERVDSEHECDMMIEALSRELIVVRDNLAFLTHHLDRSESLQNHSSSRSPVLASAPPQPTFPDQKQKKKSAKNVQSLASADVPPEEVTNRQVHYLGVVDEMEGEKARLRRNCLLLMQVHIEEQLCEVQRRGEELRKKMIRKENKIRAAKLKQKPSRFRSPGVDDASFLRNVYMSTFYQIVVQEYKLKKIGKLQSLADLENFWNYMLSPLVKQRAIPHSSQPLRFQSTDVDEDIEYADTWALTALPPEQTKTTRGMSNTPSSTTKEDVLKFVPTKLPKIKTLSELLESGQRVSKGDISKRKQMSYWLISERKKLHTMYQHAKASEITMRKLLPEPLTFDLSLMPGINPTCRFQVPEIDTTTVTHKTSSLKGQISSSPHRTSSRILSNLAQADELSIREDASALQQTSSRPVQEAATNVSLPPITVPLTMDTVLEGTRVIEPKCKSTLWTNFVTVKR